MSKLIIPARQDFPELEFGRWTMNGKPVYEIEVKTVINFTSEFGDKKLSDGYTFSLGSACAFKCVFCYVASVWRKHPQICRLLKRLKHGGIGFEDIVIRRSNALDILREQLTIKKPGFVDLSAPHVIFTSPFVDPAANMVLVHETLDACLIIFALTNWDIRILSKSSLLKNLAEKIPEQFRDRIIFGLSTGTFDDRLAGSFEQGTTLVSHRLKALHWLQDNGFRTFGMICPSLPQENYSEFACRMAKAIRVDRCEHVWGEVINVRGNSLNATVDALRNGGFRSEADRLTDVCGPRATPRWETYARQTFQGLMEHIPAGKLRFLQYVKPQTRDWWASHADHGALLLGTHRIAAPDRKETHGLQPVRP